MVDKSYMLEQPSPPSRLMTGFNQHVMPVLIDAAGSVEGRIEATSVVVRRSPVSSLLIAAGLGFLLAQAGRLRAA